MRFILYFAALLLAVAGAAPAQEFPRRPIRFVVPLPPGGSPDLTARTISSGLSGPWQQQIVVDNRPGANHNLAAEIVAKSAPDGYTWLLTTDNILTVNPHLGKTPFEPFKDFTFVMQLARFQFLLVVHPSVPAQSVQELVVFAKSKPGALNYGSSGNGSPQHLGAAMLQSLAGIQMHHIPYKGAAPAIIDLLPGRIQVWVGAANSTLPHIKDGKLRLLASAGSQRYPSLPDVPTVAEAGVPGFALNVSAGLTMPAKAPPAIVAKVNADVTKLLNAADVKARLAPQGIEIVTNSPAEYAKTVREENAVWGKIIKATGIKAD
jgi:tripartite-type tricarboxylate transporter receptor subunit TctC